MMRKQPRTWFKSVPEKLLVSITNDHRLRSCITGNCYVQFWIGGGESDLSADHTLLKRALEIYERVLGADHPDTVIIRDNYAALVRQIEADGAQS